MPVTAVEILGEYVHKAKRFTYIPDGDGGGDKLKAFLEDTWDTASEVEHRGGADCDGSAIWTLQRADEYASTLGISTAKWCFVCGLVRQRGEWLGHAWVSLIEEGNETWADPTWGLGPTAPASLGYPSSRLPLVRWTHKGFGHFDDQWYYAQQNALPSGASLVSTEAGMDSAFKTSLVVRKISSNLWVLVEPLEYRSRLAGNISVPSGFTTDFASVPRAPFAYLLAGNTGHEAAVIHDFCYRTGYLSRNLSDRVFAEGLRVLGEPTWRIILMYNAVDMFGESSYRGRVKTSGD